METLGTGKQQMASDHSNFYWIVSIFIQSTNPGNSCTGWSGPVCWDSANRIPYFLSGNIFPWSVSLCLQTFLMSRTWCSTVLTTVMCGGTPAVSVTVSLSNQSVWAEWDHPSSPALQCPHPQLTACRVWEELGQAPSSSPDNCFVWAPTDCLGFTDNETMNIKLKLNIQCG